MSPAKWLAALLAIILLAVPAAAPTEDLAPDTETITRGTTSGITNLLSDDGLTNTITEGGASQTDSYTPGSHTISVGTQSGGVVPTDWETSNDVRVQYQEANVGGPGDTTLDPDTDNVVKGSKSGTFPGDLTSDNGVYVAITETNQAGTTIAFDAAAESERIGTTDPHTWTHTPVGTARAVIVMTSHGVTATHHVLSCTYGAVSMTIVTSATDTATEPGAVRLLFLGAGIPTGAQTVSCDLDSGTTDDIHFVSISFTAVGDTESIANAVDQENQANPTETLAYGGRNAIAAMVFYSGAAAPPGTTVCSGSSACTLSHTMDQGAFGDSTAYQTTAGTTDEVMGWTQANDDVAVAYAAIAVIADMELEYQVGHTAETCAATRILRVSAHHSDTEDILVEADDGNDVGTWQSLFTVTATADPSPTYQTATLTPGQWDLGDPLFRFRGNSDVNEGTATTVSIDDMEILCDSAEPEYSVSVRLNWVGVPTTGTSWTVFVEGRRETSPETINTCIWSADELTCTNVAVLAIDTDADETNSAVLTTDQLDAGSPNINFDDSAPTDTSQSTFGLDQVRIDRIFNAYDATVQHDWLTVTPADTYELRVRASRSGTEDWNLQVWDWQDLDWLTRITVSSGVETLYTYTLNVACTGAADDCERDSAAQDVRIRWVTTSSTDETQDTLTIDQEIVQRVNNDPTLTSPANTPVTPDDTQLVTFTVTYTDVANCPASYVRVSVDGGADQAMSESDPGDTNCADGKGYTVTLGPFAAGGHTYTFKGSDGENAEVTNGPNSFTVTASAGGGGEEPNPWIGSDLLVMDCAPDWGRVRCTVSIPPPGGGGILIARTTWFLDGVEALTLAYRADAHTAVLAPSLQGTEHVVSVRIVLTNGESGTLSRTVTVEMGWLALLVIVIGVAVVLAVLSRSQRRRRERKSDREFWGDVF